MSDFSNIPHGLLPIGTVTQFGAIVGRTLTAYVLAGEPKRVVSFERVHGRPAPDMPLVVLG